VDRNSFAYRAWVLRADMGLTLKEMGELIGVPGQTWRNWEAGHSPRNMAAVVDQIHEATRVSRAWLMWGSASAR
jgi:transcriptional regulator with XRE-family HTH domain